jgi:hypothetical protein
LINININIAPTEKKIEPITRVRINYTSNLLSLIASYSYSYSKMNYSKQYWVIAVKNEEYRSRKFGPSGGLHDVYNTYDDRITAHIVMCDLKKNDKLYRNVYVEDTYSFQFEISWIRKKGRYWCFFMNDKDYNPIGGMSDIDNKFDKLKDVITWIKDIQKLMTFMNSDKTYDYHIYDSHKRYVIGGL